MRGIKKAARAALAELEQVPLPPYRLKVQELGLVLGKGLLQGGMRNWDEPFWRNVFTIQGEEFSCSADLYFRLGDFSRRVNELGVDYSQDGPPKPGIRNVSEEERKERVSNTCRAILKSKTSRKKPTKTKKRK